jgi:hypothetical protein
VAKNVRLVSIHDVLTSREARSDPTGSRAQIRGEPLPEPEPPLHERTLSGAPAPKAKSPLYGWALSASKRYPPKSQQND